MNIFGGAITCEIPTTFRDVSTMRQVPDNQEVYSLPNEDADPSIPGPCIVIELLEYQKQVSDQDAAGHYFKDLAEANGTAPENMTFTAQSLSMTPTFPNLSAVSSGIGFQNISPGRDVDVAGNPRPANPVWVRVEIAVFRLETVQTDLLVTLSTPTAERQDNNEYSPTFTRAVETLSIQNWGLFG